MSKQAKNQQKVESEQNQVSKQVQTETEPLQTAVSDPYIPALQRAYADPSSITPNDARVLQRTIGNQAMRRLVIQRKMTVGPVGDKYEQEADTVAKQVVSTLNSPQQDVSQRQEEDELAQMKPISTVQRQEEDELAQMKPISTVQRQEEDELAQMKPQPVQRDSSAGFTTEDAFEANLNRQRGGGSPLPNSLRADFEPKFNANFSGVRVHTNDQSHQLNQSIQAKAFTTGQDIFFRQGAYEPSSQTGQELIAHELTHTIQQGAAPVQKQADDQPSQVKSARGANVFSRKGAYQPGQSGGTVQRAVEGIPERNDVEAKGGAVSLRGRLTGGTYSKILGKLDALHNQPIWSKRMPLLFELQSLCMQFAHKHKGDEGKKDKLDAVQMLAGKVQDILSTVHPLITADPTDARVNISDNTSLSAWLFGGNAFDQNQTFAREQYLTYVSSVGRSPEYKIMIDLMLAYEKSPSKANAVKWIEFTAEMGNASSEEVNDANRMKEWPSNAESFREVNLLRRSALWSGNYSSLGDIFNRFKRTDQYMNLTGANNEAKEED